MNYFPYIVYAAWLASEILLNRMLRSGAKDRKNADRSSLAIIWITIVVVCVGAVQLAKRTYYPILNNWALVMNIGLGVIILGMILRFAVIRSLGRYFTVDVTIREGHKLKTDGIYRYLRHPSYAASLLSFAGLGISLNNYFSLLMLVVLVGAAFFYRIKVEEKALIGQFGNDYIKYMKGTKRLIPFIF